MRELVPLTEPSLGPWIGAYLSRRKIDGDALETIRSVAWSRMQREEDLAIVPLLLANGLFSANDDTRSLPHSIGNDPLARAYDVRFGTNSGQRPEIGTVHIARRKEGLHPLKVASAGDFQLGGPVSLGRFPRTAALPYCFDFKARVMISTLHADPDIVIAQPFLHAAQREHAHAIARIPWARLDSVFGPVNGGAKPLLIFSIGRCGSTLVHALLRTLTCRAFSEPDCLTQLAIKRLDYDRLGVRESDLIWYGLAPLIGENTTQANRCAVKFRARVNALVPQIASLLPTARYIFIFRNADDWARSTHRAFGIKPQAAARLLARSIRAAGHLAKTGVEHEIVRYEELIESPAEVLARIVNPGGGIAGSAQRETIAEIMQRDSQHGTPISRTELHSALDETHWMNSFLLEWARVKPRHLLRRLNLEI